MTLPKTMGFKSFLNVDYAPGQDPLIKKNAKKRKGADVDSGVVESVEIDEAAGDSKLKKISKTEYDKHIATHHVSGRASGHTGGVVVRSPKGTMQYKGAIHLDHDKKTDMHTMQTYSHGDHGIPTVVRREHLATKEVTYHKYVKESVDEAYKDPWKAPRKGSSAWLNAQRNKTNDTSPERVKEIEKIGSNSHHVGVAKVLSKESVEVDEAVLNPQQRRLRSLQMKRMAPRIRLGQERAKSRFADLGRLKKRAMKAARTLIFRKLTKGIPKDELTFQRRAEIEKRLDSPAMKARIERIAVKMLPKEREQEVARHRPKPAEGSQQ